MKLISAAIHNSTAVAALVIFIFILGVISIFKLPVQLTPDITTPVISISTQWHSASPEEIESQIIEQQEDTLKSLQNVELVESISRQGKGDISLFYRTGTDLNRALLDVINALNQVDFYPSDAEEPIVYVGGNGPFTAIAWYSLTATDYDSREITHYHDFVQDNVLAQLDRVQGVSKTNVFGSLENEMRINFDPYKAAALGVELQDLLDVTGKNRDISGGIKEQGRRKFRLRLAGKYDAEALSNTILHWRDGQAVRLRDVAQISLVPEQQSDVWTLNGQPGMAINIQSEPGVNIVEVVQKIDEKVERINTELLSEHNLKLEKLYDDAIYINESIDFVRNNLLLGIVFAIISLWWLIGHIRATLVIAVSIPISILIIFVAMQLMGRTLNIISMAGIAFSVGMILDAAIVVLENITRLRTQGESSFDAAVKGALQVKNALIVSTATTIIVFLPIAFLEEVSGQLFSDLAVTISIAIVSSLVVATILIPGVTGKEFIGGKLFHSKNQQFWESSAKSIMSLYNSSKKRLTWIVVLTFGSITICWILFPKFDYLPKGNQNAFQAYLITPPGLSLAGAKHEISDQINERLKPYISGEKQPQLKNTYMGIMDGFGFIGGSAKDVNDIPEVIKTFQNEILVDFPDLTAYASQSQLFNEYGGGRQIQINFQGSDIKRLFSAAKTGIDAVRSEIPNAQAYPKSGLAFVEPEFSLTPKDEALAKAQWNKQSLANFVQAAGSGLYAGEYFDGKQHINMYLRANVWKNIEELRAFPVYIQSTGIHPLGQFMQIDRTAGPSSITRINHKRTVSLLVTPPDELSLEETIALIKEHVEPQISSKLAPEDSISYQGTARDLDKAVGQLGSSFVIALVILYLLIASLFRSFRDGVLIMLSIPLAAVGGIIMLAITNIFVFQPLDLLTMIGFVILLGLVVNNAILLVDQTKKSMEIGLDLSSSLEMAITFRLRPIIMTSFTSICGMLPLLLIPGPGAEFYRGIAAVIVGGMSLSTLCTLIYLPCLMHMITVHSNIPPNKELETI